MSTACGRPQGRGALAHVDREGRGQKPDSFVDVINEWPLITIEPLHHTSSY